MNSKRLLNYSINTLLLCLSLAFIIRFGGSSILKQYIAYGIGSCKNIPILCMEPNELIIQPQPANQDYLQGLVLQKFPRMSILCPKGFSVVQELIKRPYYKKNRWLDKGKIIYLLPQEPGEFLKLYPDVKKQGVKNNYDFIERLNSANLNKLKNITDAFFIIMKSVFTPDLGNQGIVKMIRFNLPNSRGFINYNLSYPDNYFDCNVIDSADNFYKVYIKDIGNTLDLNKVFAIISTIKPLK